MKKIEFTPQRKKWLLIGLSSLAGLIFLTLAGLWAWDNVKYGKYVHDPYGISVKYPRDWIIHHNIQGALVAFVSPKDTALDIFQENANIVVEDVPPSLVTLEEFSNKTIEQMNAVFKDNINIVESTPIKVGHYDAHRFVIEGNTPGEELRMINIWLLKGSKSIIFTGLIFIADAETYWPIIERMADSFHVK